jgi:hypothetical protein
MNQDENTKEELINNGAGPQSLLKHVLKDTEDLDKTGSPRKKSSKYSQKKEKQGKATSTKKTVKFKEKLEDVVYIESFKSFNQKMCFDDYKDNVIETKKTCCDESNCIVY